MNIISYVNIVITADDDGYSAACPDVQGAFAEGDTLEEAVFNCIDVLNMIADYRKEPGNKLPGYKYDAPNGANQNKQGDSNETICHHPNPFFVRLCTGTACPADC